MKFLKSLNLQKYQKGVLLVIIAIKTQTIATLEQLYKIIDDINSAQPTDIVSLDEKYGQTIFQKLDRAVIEINNADLIICFRGISFQHECLLHEDIAITKKKDTANIIPVALEGNISENIPISLQNSHSLVYKPKDYGSYSIFFSDLLSKIGILNEATKSSFDKISLELRRHIDIEYKDENILSLIHNEEIKIEKELKNILGLT